MEANKQILHKLLQPEKFEPIAKKAFDSADSNKNGAIERSELAAVMKKVTQELDCPEPTKEIIDKKFNELDLNKNGKLEYSEFKEFVKELLVKSLN